MWQSATADCPAHEPPVQSTVVTHPLIHLQINFKDARYRIARITMFKKSTFTDF